MDVYFSTVVRSAPPHDGGKLVRLDWLTGEVRAAVTIAPTNPALPDPNPRGNTRGGRGVAVLGDEVWVASYHTLKVFDRELNLLRDISHPLFVGLHEIHPTERGTMWVSATAIDAAVEVDRATGKTVRALWPREHPVLQDRFGLVPLEIDKEADNRTRFLANTHLDSESHVHLNAVTEHEGMPYGLFNRVGAVVDLERGELVAQDERIRGGHNLVFDAKGCFYVNDTLGQRLVSFQPSAPGEAASDAAASACGLDRFLPARRLWTEHRIKKWLRKRKLLGMSPARPMFMRGLALSPDGQSAFIGTSPATLLEVDLASGDLRRSVRYSRDVRCCIHGLCVVDDAGAAG